MCGQKQIIIDIDSEGNCSIDGEGFVGPECSNFIGEIEQALGQCVTQKDKPEYHQRTMNTRRNTQTGGR